MSQQSKPKGDPTILVKPGEIITITFDQVLPVDRLEPDEDPITTPKRVWRSGMVDILRVPPNSVTFRVWTKEKWDSLNRELEDHYWLSVPRELQYPNTRDSTIWLTFALETPKRMREATRLQASSRGVEIKPLVNKTKARFFITGRKAYHLWYRNEPINPLR